MKRYKISPEYFEAIELCKELDIEFNKKGFSAVSETDIMNLITLVKNNVVLGSVSNRRELYFAFMKEYNQLMGEGEQEILKEEVEVLLAKYSC